MRDCLNFPWQPHPESGTGFISIQAGWRQGPDFETGSIRTFQLAFGMKGKKRTVQVAHRGPLTIMGKDMISEGVGNIAPVPKASPIFMMRYCIMMSKCSKRNTFPVSLLILFIIILINLSNIFNNNPFVAFRVFRARPLVQFLLYIIQIFIFQTPCRSQKPNGPLSHHL